ncbi:HAD family hydrolase [Salinicola rhizosphaerae]|uniref:HAD family hydrolase n=1 Tax=Salinicola rhizosphaerae TaxID=1443141 RepID=UPI00227D952E|nr:HAD-IA family hydrolase [Salinicola rhizosphaerae]
MVIFDWDGTLMDSAPRIVAAMQAAARDLKWRVLGDAAIRDIIGLGLPEALAALYPERSLSDRQSLQSRYGELFRQADSRPTPFFLGVEAGIERLRQTGGCRLAVATGKSRRGLDRAFAHVDCGRWFDHSRTADMTRSKPHPQMLEELLAESGVAAADAVMIGDTEYDLEMARVIGMDRVAVTYGVHARERLMASQPSLIADTFPDVVDWLMAAERARSPQCAMTDTIAGPKAPR